MRLRATRLSATGFNSRRLSSVFASSAAALSLRLPSGSTYGGSCVRVRRSSDNTEQNFGFGAADANGNRFVDTAAILTFCGVGNGFVTTWYDQSSASRNATQTTAALQPRIVNAGVLETQGGVACINFMGTTWFTWGVPYAAGLTLNFVGFPSPAGGNDYLLSSVAGGGNQAALLSGYLAPFEYMNGATNNPRFALQTAQAQSIISVTSQDGGNVTGYLNGAQGTTAGAGGALAGAQSNQLGAVTGLAPFAGNLQEFTIFQSALAATTRSALEISQGTAFGVLINSSVFAGASVAYSTRIPSGNTYSGPLIRVRRSSDNTEQDFGATSIVDANGDKWLDTAALLTFVGAGNGFVTTWYDQAGSGRHMAQATAGSQPSIVTAGVVLTSAGRPAVFTTTGKSMSNTGAWLVTGNADRALNAIMSRSSGAAFSVWSGAYGTTQAFGFDLGSSFTFTPFTYGAGDIQSATVAVLTPSVLTASRLSGVSSGFVNGTSRGTDSDALNTSNALGFGIGLRPDGVQSTGFYSEIAYFGAALSTTTRQALERSQGTAFGITVA